MSILSALKQVIASYTVKVDDKPLTELDKKMAKTNERIKLVGGVIGAVGLAVAAGAYKMTEMASAAEEMENVLSVTFGKDGLSRIQSWSQSLGKEMGRSQYTLQEGVSTFGKVMKGPLEGTGADIEGMSKKLTELAVDLGSFNNISDEEAQRRLKSGLLGETESARELGVDLSDTTLDELSKKMYGKRISAVSLDQKMLIRYQKIMESTKHVQGDAVRTADQYANSMKRLKERMKEFATNMGKKLLPVMTKLLHFVTGAFEGLATVIEYLFNNTNLFILALVAGAAAYAKFSYPMIKSLPIMSAGFKGLSKAAWAASAPMLKIMLALAVIDDVISFFRGDDSLIGKTFTNITGLVDPLKVLAEAFEDLGRHISNLFNMFTNIPSSLKALFTGGSAGAALTSGNVDVGKMRTMAGEARIMARQGAIERGDHNEAMKYRARDETVEEAKQNIVREIAAAKRTRDAEAAAQRDRDAIDRLKKDPAGELKRMAKEKEEKAAEDRRIAKEKAKEQEKEKVVARTVSRPVPGSEKATGAGPSDKQINIGVVNISGAQDPVKAIKKAAMEGEALVRKVKR